MSVLDTASLIVTPNAYKEGKLYSVIPSNGSGDLSVTRATTATRVNTAGLVELVPYNIFEYSEQFDNGYWNKLGSTIGANSVVAPNGTTTADKVIETSTTADHYVTRASNFTQGLTYTISVYAKAGERNWLAIGFNNEAQRLAWFNLSTGVVGNVLSSVTATSIESVGNGWYRCSATMTAATNLPYPSIMIAPSNGVKNYLGNGTNGLYIWGAQFVEGASALSYQRTETRLNIPRLDYSLGSCPSLLVEPQRTNLAFYSQEFSNIYWGSNFTSITKNLLSPSGIVNADTIVNNNGVNRSISRPISVVSGQTYVLSFWIKKISGAFVNSSAIQLTSWGPAVAAQTYTNLGYTLTTDWVRYTHTFTATSTNTVYIQFVSNELNTIGLWGAQLEAGAYPTSYIPTTSASVTRNADVISKTGISSLLNPSQGTFFVEASPFQSSEEKAIQLSNGSDLNVVMLNYYGSNEIRCSVIGSGSTYYRSVNTNVYNIKKMAVSWKSTGVYLYLNGVEYSVPLTAGSGGGVPSTLDRLTFSYWWSGFPFLTNTKAVGVWKTQLTSAQCIALTTI